MIKSSAVIVLEENLMLLFKFLFIRLQTAIHLINFLLLL